MPFVISSIGLYYAYRGNSNALMALVQNQRQFEKTNEPYLEITQPELVTFAPNQQIFIKYNLVNLKPSPVKILGEKTITTYCPTDTIKPIYRNWEQRFDNEFKSSSLAELRNVNQYIVKESPFQDSILSNYKLYPDTFNRIDRGLYWIVIKGGIRYQNLVNDSIRDYFYEVAIKPQSGGGAYSWFAHNDNKSLKVDSMSMTADH
jgi:hypothetical protein